jgi:hypothetical protein
VLSKEIPAEKEIPWVAIICELPFPSFSFALQLLFRWDLQVSLVLEAEQVWRLAVALVVEKDLWA